jgi:ribonuclease-3 family protein
MSEESKMGEDAKLNDGIKANENVKANRDAKLINDSKINVDINSVIGGEFPLKKADVNLYSPLVLAYAGDAVYELYVRTLLLSHGNAPVHKLHKRSIAFVKAKAQSDTIHRLMSVLSGEEQDIVRRGRNAKSGTIPKNADVTDYKYATGFETLLGYLYVNGDYTRLLELMKMSVLQDQGGI